MCIFAKRKLKTNYNDENKTQEQPDKNSYSADSADDLSEHDGTAPERQTTFGQPLVAQYAE
jgi:hypothetical protein